MPFITKCPYCRLRVRVPDRALAESLKCPSCQSWYTVAPDTDPAPNPDSPPATPPPIMASLPRLELTPENEGGVETAASPAAPPSASHGPPLTTPILTSELPPDESEDEGWKPHPLGVLACIAGGVTLIAATRPGWAFLTRPLSAVGFLLGGVALLHALGGRPVRQLFPAAGVVLSGLVLAVALFAPGLLGPRYEVSRIRSDYDPEAVRMIPLKLGRDSASGLEANGWADASRAAVQQGNVRVQVTGAVVGPVQVVDSKKRYTKFPLLAVGVRVQHLGHGPLFRFVHWGTTGERTVPQVVATRDGTRLTPAHLGADVPAGVTYGHDVYETRALDDLLVFEAPAGHGPVRLELPAEAWGGRGSFRFQIPASMIVTQRGPKPR